MALISVGNKKRYLTVTVLYILLAMSAIAVASEPLRVVSQAAMLKLNAFAQEVPDPQQGMQDVEAPEKKSVFKALIYSLALPGAGEAYVGATGWSKIFLSVEALGWGLFISNRLNRDWRLQDSQSFAVEHARVNSDGKDDDFWLSIGKYDNLYEYNEQRRRDRNVNAIYAETAANYWQWDSKSNRLAYDWKRIQAKQLENRETYFVGGLVLNHIISAINAMRLARAHNRGIDELSWRFDMDMDYARGDWKVGISTQF